MKIGQMLPSSYLKQADFDRNGLIVTVARLRQENVAPDDKPPEQKWVLYFKEFEKGLVLNSININTLAVVCGSDESDNWVDKEVIVYVDPTIVFGGKIVGGLRIREAAEPQAPQRREPVRPAARNIDDFDAKGNPF